MDSKICTECKIEKSLDDYYKYKNNQCRPKCKLCLKNIYLKQPKFVPITTGTKKCSICNINKPVFEFNKRAASNDGLNTSCKDCKHVVDKVYYNDHSEVISKRATQWIKDNPKRFRERINKYQKNKEQVNPNFKISRRIRSRLYHALIGKFKNGSAIKSLDCPIDVFKDYIEKIFEVGMNWNNYGLVWHLDHIKPLNLFNLEYEEEFKQACHYTNYRPLWKLDNVRKGDSFSFLDKQNLELAQIYDYLKNTLNQEMQITENKLTISNKNIVIRYCNLNLNGELQSGRKIQIENFEVCNTNNMRTITIFEDEWIYKQEQVKGFLKSIFDLHRIKVGARKCVVKRVDYNDIKSILNENHLQGAVAGQFYYAIYYEGKIIAASVWGQSNVSRNLEAKEDEVELIRYCVKNGIKVMGGLSKIIKMFINEHPQFNKIISYSDNRWSVGNIYEKLGFIKTKTGEPSYWYFINGNDGPREHRYTWRKQKAIEQFGKELETDTEWDIMKRNGYDRIWDCGSARWDFVKS